MQGEKADQQGPIGSIETIRIDVARLIINCCKNPQFFVDYNEF